MMVRPGPSSIFGTTIIFFTSFFPRKRHIHHCLSANIIVFHSRSSPSKVLLSCCLAVLLSCSWGCKINCQPIGFFHSALRSHFFASSTRSSFWVGEQLLKSARAVGSVRKVRPRGGSAQDHALLPSLLAFL